MYGAGYTYKAHNSLEQLLFQLGLIRERQKKTLERIKNKNIKHDSNKLDANLKSQILFLCQHVLKNIFAKVVILNSVAALEAA